MAEEEKEEDPQSLDEFKKTLEQRVRNIWIETIKGMEEAKDDSLTPEDLIELFEQTKAFDFDFDLSWELDEEFQNLGKDNRRKFYWKFNIDNPEATILTYLSTGLERFSELMHEEGNVQSSAEVKEQLWDIFKNSTTYDELPYTQDKLDEYEQINSREASSEYSKMVLKGLINWLIEDRISEGLDSLYHFEDALLKAGSIDKKNPNLQQNYVDKLNVIIPLVKRKLRTLKPEDAEL
jgi:hypothetical protein